MFWTTAPDAECRQSSHGGRGDGRDRGVRRGRRPLGGRRDDLARARSDPRRSPGLRDGVVPEPGRSIADIAGTDVRETILSVSHDDGNGCRSFDLELLASLAPLEERDAYLTFLRATQRPQGWAALEQPWPGPSLPDVPRTYVLCTEDQIIPPARQREMATRLGVEPIEIASEHAVFTFQPRELAAVLAGQADPRERPGSKA
jgi:hypothetical protein